MVEVAWFISTPLDISGIEEDGQKGNTPKESLSCYNNSWVYSEELYNCHLKDGVLSKDSVKLVEYVYFRGELHWSPLFLH